MPALRSLDDGLSGRVNAMARDTPWLDGVILCYPTYGVLASAVLLPAGVTVQRRDVGIRSAVTA
jgi:hypothetical protein